MLLATGYEPTTTFDSKGPLGFETNKQTFYKLPKSSSFEDRIDAASILFRAHLNKRSFVAIGYGRGGRGIIGQRPGQPQCIHFFYTAAIRFKIELYADYTATTAFNYIGTAPRFFTIGPFLENRPKDAAL